MSDLSKPVVTICVAIGGASLSGLMYNIFSKKQSNCSKKDDDNTNNGDNINDDDDGVISLKVDSCKCPFANTLAVSVTGGVISGALSWYML